MFIALVLQGSKKPEVPQNSGEGEGVQLSVFLGVNPGAIFVMGLWIQMSGAAPGVWKGAALERVASILSEM